MTGATAVNQEAELPAVKIRHGNAVSHDAKNTPAASPPANRQAMPPTASPLSPNSCLVAILLVIKTKTSPRVVFHYPAAPSVSAPSTSRDPAWYGAAGVASNSSDSSDDDEYSSESDSGRADGENSSRTGSRSSGGRGSKRDTLSSLKSSRPKSGPVGGAGEDVDEDMPGRGGERDGKRFRDRNEETRGRNAGGPDWERILGFSAEGLSKLLSPGRAYNKRRFELCLDQLVFLGAPRFVREDGLWKKKRRKRRDHAPAGEAAEDPGSPPGQPPNGTGQSPNGTSQSELELEQVPYFEPAYGHGLMSGAASEADSSRSASTGDGDGHDLIMFNVVFVLNPPALEYQTRVREMYDNVAKKFAKALKYAQGLHNYVYLESRALYAMKEKARENRTSMYTLWPSLANNSSLAKAIAMTFNAISHDKIAHVNLGRDIDTSFQIPQALSTRYAPGPAEPQMPGLWLTTAAPLADDDGDHAATLSPHSALLLLQDDEALLKEVESDAKELSGPLAYFVRHLTPTKSLKKVAAMSSLSLKDVQLLARHLVYWRRGRAIPPLRWRDTYVVSPNANMRSLRSAAARYAARFPTLPSLPKMLQSLSGPPRPYFHLMPTKDHRAAYMEILAWLMRYGWVTQLRTFGWVLVGREAKAAVAAQLEQERRQQHGRAGGGPGRRDRSVSGSSSRAGALDRSAETLLDAGSERVSSPLLRPPPDDQRPAPGASPRPRAASDAASVSSGRTVLTAAQAPFSPPARAPDDAGRAGGRLAPPSLADSPRLGSDRDAGDGGGEPSGRPGLAGVDGLAARLDGVVVVAAAGRGRGRPRGPPRAQHRDVAAAGVGAGGALDRADRRRHGEGPGRRGAAGRVAEAAQVPGREARVGGHQRVRGGQEEEGGGGARAAGRGRVGCYC